MNVMSTQTKIADPHKISGFAEWLRDSLESRGLKPVDLARSLRIQPSTITRWLAGSVPHVQTLERVQQFLQAHPAGVMSSVMAASITAPDTAGPRLEAIRSTGLIDDVLCGFDHKDLIRLARLLSMPNIPKELVLDRVFRALEREDAKDLPPP